MACGPLYPRRPVNIVDQLAKGVGAEPPSFAHGLLAHQHGVAAIGRGVAFQVGCHFAAQLGASVRPTAGTI